MKNKSLKRMSTLPNKLSRKALKQLKRSKEAPKIQDILKMR